MSPKISIIVPVYKVEPYLDKCVESLVNQTLEDIEIILVDDGSPDNCPEKCDAWAQKDNRIKVVHKKNSGLGFARNSGLEIATGTYVAFVDSDDYVDINMYRKLYDASESESCDAVFCGIKQLASDGSVTGYRDYANVISFNAVQTGRLALSFLNKTELNENERLFMSVWHSIYKKKLIDGLNLSFYSERDILSEDIPFQIFLVRNASLVKFIPDMLYVYRCNPNSLSHNFKLDKFESSARLRILLHNLVSGLEDGDYFVDLEFYGRIRYLLTQFVFSKNYSLGFKLRFLTALSYWECVEKLELDRLYAEKSRKYMMQLNLLKRHMPCALFMFVIFDRLVNKDSIMFWKK